MFETIESTEAVMPSMFSSPEKHVWWSMHLNTHRQWFYLIYQTQDNNGSELTNVIFLTRAKQIAEMLLIKDCHILEVYLVSPGYINGSNGWKMDKIKEVWRARIRNDEFDMSARIFILDNNTEYMHSYYTTDNDSFTKEELIFKI